jgi:glutamyl/glutaminyl-tRNA synthetase
MSEEKLPVEDISKVPSLSVPPSQVVGRLAPSPTGAQHVGNARTYLIAWLSVRSRGGRVVLRIEDIDSPRVKPGAIQGAIEDLRWLGLDWDDGPIFQTDRVALYQGALGILQAKELQLGASKMKAGRSTKEAPSLSLGVAKR